MKLNGIVLDEPKPEEGGGIEETKVVVTETISIDKAIAVEVRETKKAKDARAAKDAKETRLLPRPNGIPFKRYHPGDDRDQHGDGGNQCNPSTSSYS